MSSAALLPRMTSPDAIEARSGLLRRIDNTGEFVDEQVCEVFASSTMAGDNPPNLAFFGRKCNAVISLAVIRLAGSKVNICAMASRRGVDMDLLSFESRWPRKMRSRSTGTDDAAKHGFKVHIYKSIVSPVDYPNSK
jgi:hypothetical protein